jgi:hypothetical protein
MRPRPRRSFHHLPRGSACASQRPRPVLGRGAPHQRTRAGVSATHIGPRHCAQPQTPTATPLPSHWLHDLTARVSTSVHRLLTLARRELAAALVPIPEH